MIERALSRALQVLIEQRTLVDRFSEMLDFLARG